MTRAAYPLTVVAVALGSFAIGRSLIWRPHETQRALAGQAVEQGPPPSPTPRGGQLGADVPHARALGSLVEAVARAPRPSADPERVAVPQELSLFQRAALSIDQAPAAFATKHSWDALVFPAIEQARRACIRDGAELARTLRVRFRVRSRIDEMVVRDIRVDLDAGAPLADADLPCLAKQLAPEKRRKADAGNPFLADFEDEIVTLVPLAQACADAPQPPQR